MPEQELLSRLSDCLDAGELISEREQRVVYSQDIAGGDVIAAAVVRPASTDRLAGAVSIASGLGYRLLPRGSGHSYSSGSVPVDERSIIIDTSALNRVIEIDANNRYVRVEAGCTWATLFDTLSPLGLRTPFFGPLSGFRSTVGGALSQRATFFGSAMHGFSDRSVLGQTIVLADGRILRTGTGHDGRPHPQPGGPDIGALFLGDCGAFGIKTEATLRLIREAGAEVFASFNFPDAASMLAAQVALVGRDGVSECFGFDRQAHINLSQGGFEFLEGAEIATDLLRQAGSPVERLGRLVDLFRHGRRSVADLDYSLHICVEGEDEDHATARLARAGALAVEAGGLAIPDTIPRVTRSRPFRPIKALLGPHGERWLPCHGVFRAGDAMDAYRAYADVLAGAATDLNNRGMNVSLLTVSSGDAIILEPQIFWPDSLHRFHRHHVTERQLKQYGERPERPEIRAFAFALRRRLGNILHAAGGEHLQIGRYYPYEEELDDVHGEIMRAIKRTLDPGGLMSPGNLFTARGTDN